MPKIALGTVQFGLPYGITNTQGQVSEQEVCAIFSEAQAVSPNMILDTAPGYGNSETVLGSVLSTLPGHQFKIVTKTVVSNSAWDEKFRHSLERLKVPSVYGLLDHNAGHLLGVDSDQAYQKMIALKADGLTQKIGASVYNADQIDRILNLGPIDILQVPLNIFDQRLLQSGHLSKLKKLGVEIHVRSAFLQGIALQNSKALPVYFLPFQKYFNLRDKACADHNVSLLQFALGFLKSLDDIHEIVVGVTTVQQFIEIMNSFHSIDFSFDYSSLAVQEEQFLNPSLWKVAS